MSKEPMDKNLNKVLFDEGKKGMVILSVTAKNSNFKNNSNSGGASDLFGKIVSNSKNTLVPKISKYNMYWVKEDKAIEEVNQRDGFLISKGKAENGWKNMVGVDSDIADAKYAIYMLDEGKYDLYQLGVFNSFMVFSGNNQWSSAGNYEKKLASFEVKNGEVLYLGDLDIFYKSATIDRTKHGENIRIKVADRHQDAKSFLKSYYPDLTKKLEKRLIEGRIVLK
jgi:predicted DNA-binding antitoxin AbrB/MazE fold protein